MNTQDLQDDLEHWLSTVRGGAYLSFDYHCPLRERLQQPLRLISDTQAFISRLVFDIPYLSDLRQFISVDVVASRFDRQVYRINIASFALEFEP